MPELIKYALTIITGYLIGSLNAGIIISRLILKDDIRNHGSCNAGMTNAFRVMGKKGGIAVLAADVTKTLAACLAGMLLLGDIGIIIAGIAAVAGHCYPLYFGFKGGKGILETVSAVLIFDWRVALVCLAIFFAALIIKRIVSLSSIIAAATFPFVTLMFGFVDKPHYISPFYIIALAALGAFLIFQHRDNLKRLINGTEKPLSY